MAKCTRCGGSGKEPDWVKLGKKIRTARLRRQLGVRELARLAEVSHTYITVLESGDAAGLSGEKAQRVLAILGVDP